MRVPFKLRVPIFKSKTFSFEFVFEKKFSTKENIISLGSACHPAHLLDAMKFRKQSQPFDWLLTDPVLGMEYVCENIKLKFKYFTTDLILNKENHISASRYMYSCFFHHPTILTDKNVLNTYAKRSNRFLNTLQTHTCVFLYSATSASLNTINDVNKLVTAIVEFMQLIKPSDKLLVYINCEESLDENKKNCDLLIDELKKINQVNCTRFLLEEKKYGLWGYENNYYALLKELGVNIKIKFPKISIVKTVLNKKL